MLTDRQSLQSPSQPNAIFNGPLTQATSGQPQLLLPNSTVQSFALKSTAYACTAQSGAAAISCEIQFTARDLHGVTAIQTVVYDLKGTAGVVKAPSNSTAFPTKGFSNLKEVDIAVVQSTTGQLTTLALLDNVSYDAVVAKRGCRRRRETRESHALFFSAPGVA